MLNVEVAIDAAKDEAGTDIAARAKIDTAKQADTRERLTVLRDDFVVGDDVERRGRPACGRCDEHGTRSDRFVQFGADGRIGAKRPVDAQL